MQAVLIPLKKEATAKRQNAFTVEMVWVDPPQPAMGARGELLFELPKVRQRHQKETKKKKKEKKAKKEKKKKLNGNIEMFCWRERVKCDANT